MEAWTAEAREVEGRAGVARAAAEERRRQATAAASRIVVVVVVVEHCRGAHSQRICSQQVLGPRRHLFLSCPLPSGGSRGWGIRGHRALVLIGLVVHPLVSRLPFAALALLVGLCTVLAVRLLFGDLRRRRSVVARRRLLVAGCPIGARPSPTRRSPRLRWMVGPERPNWSWRRWSFGFHRGFENPRSRGAIPALTKREFSPQYGAGPGD